MLHHDGIHPRGGITSNTYRAMNNASGTMNNAYGTLNKVDGTVKMSTRELF